MLSVFIVDHLPASGEVILDGDEGHHAAKVTRVNVGEELIVTDGRGSSARVKVIGYIKKKLRVPLSRRRLLRLCLLHFPCFKRSPKVIAPAKLLNYLPKPGSITLFRGTPLDALGNGKKKMSREQNGRCGQEKLRSNHDVVGSLRFLLYFQRVMPKQRFRNMTAPFFLMKGRK